MKLSLEDTRKRNWIKLQIRGAHGSISRVLYQQVRPATAITLTHYEQKQLRVAKRHLDAVVDYWNQKRDKEEN